MAILSIIIPQIHEYDKSFHVPLASSVSIFSLLNVRCMILTLSWLDLFQDIFETSVNGFIFLISFLLCFSFVYLELLASEILLDPHILRLLTMLLFAFQNLVVDIIAENTTCLSHRIQRTQTGTFLEAPLLLDNFRYDRRYSVHYQRKVITDPTPTMNTVSYNNDWPGETCSLVPWWQKSYGSNQAPSE